MPRERGSGPRWISQHLEGSPTPRASEIVEASPDDNLGGGGTVRVTSTRPAPGAEAVVAETEAIAGHTDDDSHVRVVDGEPELVEREPVEPLERGGAPVEGAPPGSPPAPLEGAPEIVEVDNGPGSEGSLDASTADAEQRVGDDGDEPLAGGGSSDVTLTATAGTPGRYEPDVHGGARPSTIAELNEQVDLGDAEAWPEGTWLPYGTGKRAHWHGAGWATGESPGYAPA